MTNQEVKKMYLEAQKIKLNIDNLYDNIINKKITFTDNEIDKIIEQVHNYHKLFWSKFSEINMAQNNEFKLKIKKMSYSVESALTYIVYHLEGIDISNINLEYKKGINF